MTVADITSVEAAVDGWLVRVGELSLCERDVTVEQAADICRLAGGGWEMLDPMHSPAAAAAIVTCILVADGAKPELALARVNGMLATELLACVVRG